MSASASFCSVPLLFLPLFFYAAVESLNFFSLYFYFYCFGFLQTRELIEDLKSASGGGTPGGDMSKFGGDTQKILRVLCHRSDSEANQFLKKQFKLPRSAA